MNKFMERALQLAQKAFDKQEVPIGAVIVKNGKIVAACFNRRERTQNAINHAEVLAINKACRKLKSWRLDDCQMYVTLEPCPMCAGAIANARIQKVFVAAKQKTSDDDLCSQIFLSQRLNHKVEVEFLPEYEQAASNLLTKFFKDKRHSLQP